MRYSSLGKAVLLATTAMVPFGATAQEASGPLEEIIVTASKRAGGLDVQDYGAGLTVVDADDLEVQNIVDFDFLTAQLPSVNIQTFGPGDSNYIVRGITSGTGEATVGVFFDESPISGRFQDNGGGRQAAFKLIDLERIEVLKGPQGTLFGANSLSGTVRFITRKPNMDEFEGFAEAQIADVAESDEISFGGNAVINVPIIPGTLSSRLVIYGDRTAGYIDNPRLNIQDQNTAETAGLRFHLQYEPTDRLTILGTVNYQEREVDNDSRFTPEGATGVGGFVFTDLDEVQPEIPGGDFISTQAAQTPSNEEFMVASLTAEYEADFGVFTANYSRYDREFLYTYDSTPTNVGPGLIGFFTGALGFDVSPTSQVRQPQNREIDTFEFRFASELDGPLNFVAGAFISNEDSRFDLNVINSDRSGRPLEEFVPGSPTQVTGSAGPGEVDSVFGRFLINDRERRAGFFEGYYELTPEIEATFGIRYFTFNVQDSQDNTGPDFLADGVVDVVENDEQEFNYKGNITYRPTEDQTYYAQVASGFRPGATNISAGIAALSDEVVPTAFVSDTLWNYELGAKLQFMDQRFTLNAAAFYIDWSDVQIEQGTNFTFAVNGPDARVIGLEFDGRAVLAPWLEVGAAATYLDTRFQEDQVADPGVTDPFLIFEGDEIPNTPSFAANANVTFPFELDAFAGSLRVDYSYKGDSNTRAASRDAQGNPNPDFREIPSYNLVNANLTIRRDNWSAGIFVKNLFDELAVVDVLSSEQDPFAFLTVAPRTVGFRVRSNF